MKELQAIVAALTADGAPAHVMATLVGVEGSSYRRPGARLIVAPDGRRTGSISGGCLEEDVLARAARVRATGGPEAVVYDTTSENDLVWGVGLGCHGVVRVLLEPLPPRPAWAVALAAGFAARRSTRLAVTHDGTAPSTWGTALASPGPAVPDAGSIPAIPADAAPAGVFHEEIPPPTALCIFGAGDDAQPLARLAAELGWPVTVADPRPAMATAARFPGAHRLIAAPCDTLVARAAPDAATVAVVMTHHYVHDVPLLRDLSALPLPYLGLLGPKKRAEKILADLAAAGTPVPPAAAARLHAPVGLDLGADAPEQVALAILAEIQAALTGRSARPLRERTRPIHE
jgi:xanthine/CO dehydrogenase XdhC/CoxF family maturation factor